MQYSLFKNIIYVYKKVFNFNKKLKVLIPIEMLSELLIPIMSTVIPAVAVGLITNKASAHDFLLVMGGITILYAVLLYLKQYLFNLIDVENCLVRMQEFFLENSVKLMKTDYPNVEPQDKQILIEKALNSLESNWVGPEYMMKNTPKFIINIIGLIIYGTMISSLSYVIIIILVLMAVLNFVLASYARNYDQKHKDEYVKYDRKFNYLYANSTSLINGKDVRMYKMEDWFSNIFGQLIKKRVTWSKKIEGRYFLPSISDNIFLFIRDIVAYSILITMVLNKKISVDTFILFVGVIGGFSTWLNEAVTAYSNLKRANMGVNDYRAYEEINEVFNRRNGCKLPKASDYPLTIEFKNVSFKYPSSDKDTISHLNIKIEGGSKIALVGNNGAGKTTLVKLLSGGQMQKLMLARALYKNAPIMILDEPTAALDPIAESELYEKYTELTKEKTSLFISHRLSSTKFCSRILYFEKGNVIEDGTHEELMSKSGKYAQMFEIQSHYYKDDVEEHKNEEYAI